MIISMMIAYTKKCVNFTCLYYNTNLYVSPFPTLSLLHNFSIIKKVAQANIQSSTHLHIFRNIPIHFFSHPIYHINNICVYQKYDWNQEYFSATYVIRITNKIKQEKMLQRSKSGPSNSIGESCAKNNIRLQLIIKNIFLYNKKVRHSNSIILHLQNCKYTY